MHPSPKNSPAYSMAMTASFPACRKNRELYCTLLKIVNRGALVALGKYGLSFAISYDLPLDSGRF